MQIKDLVTREIKPGKCSICGMDKKDCPMLTGEMDMAGAPFEIRGIKNRREL